MKIAIVTLGCAKNSVDSSYMRAALEKKGAVIVDDAASADVVLINTCGFIEPAKKESIETILDAAGLKEGRDVRLAVTGCLVERYGEELRRDLPEVDLFVDLAAEKDIDRLLFEGRDGLIRGRPGHPPAPLERHVDGRPSAYVKIADGCDNRCSYCAIPLIRGPYRSRPMDEVVSEARDLVDGGTKEICLIAQDTTAYGIDIHGHRSLPGLMKAVSEIEGLRWLRVLYAQPAHLTDDFIEAMASTPKVLPYLDLPLQHASDRIVRSMKRWGDKRRYLELIAGLRAAVPSITLRTSVIVGFPGETDEDFWELAGFLKEADLDYAGIFEFSPEEGTDAFNLPERLPEELVRERSHELSKLIDDMMLSNARRKIGKTAPVLIEAVEDGYSIGRAPWQAPEVDGNVCIDGEAQIGTIREAAIVSTDGFDYQAKPAPRAGE